MLSLNIKNLDLWRLKILVYIIWMWCLGVVECKVPHEPMALFLWKPEAKLNTMYTTALNTKYNKNNIDMLKWYTYNLIMWTPQNKCLHINNSRLMFILHKKSDFDIYHASSKWLIIYFTIFSFLYKCYIHVELRFTTFCCFFFFKYRFL